MRFTLAETPIGPVLATCDGGGALSGLWFDRAPAPDWVRDDAAFSALRAQGYQVAREIAFRDHHWFSARDVARVEHEARAAGAAWIVTTEKDAVRLPPVGEAWLRLPMRVTIEPDAAFAAWLAARLIAARGKPEKRGRESLRKTK